MGEYMYYRKFKGESHETKHIHRFLSVLRNRECSSRRFYVNKTTVSTTAFRHGANVLEIGCGTGKTAAYMVRNFGYKVTAVEKNEIMIQKAKDRWLSEGIDIQLIEGKAEQLPCLHDSFEFVLGESILALQRKKGLSRSAIVYYRRTES